MSMQTDVKSTYLAADGVVFAGRTRLRGVTVSVAVAGTALVIYDNAPAASGTALLTLSTAIAGSYSVLIPGEGILAQNGLFLDINGAAGVTAFYG